MTDQPSSTRKMTPGSRWMSAVCNTEVVVTRAPSTEASLECGGSPMVPVGSARAAGVAPSADHSGGSLLGKRYADATAGLEVLCTKGGQGSLSINGKALALRATTPLPSSD
jgi:hypothetical protein